ncbi:MAG: hypothetical protein K2I56_03875, partial [Muribaculaceae bacterium]|nr:hypothetical protein [Muribaculaceae bacterium]
MRKLFLSIIIAVCGLACTAQSIDERIANAMNCSDWIALDSIYSAAPKDSIMPFLEVYSRALIGNRLNRPDISIPAFGELLNNHSANLDLSNLLNSSVMLSMDLSKVGQNDKAAEVVVSVLDATRQYITVNTELNPLASDYECNLGLKSLMQFGKIRFNMIDFTFTTDPAELTAAVLSKRNVPTFRLTQVKPSFLQYA